MKKRIALLVAICLLLCCPIVYADTDGTEPVTDLRVERIQILQAIIS